MLYMDPVQIVRPNKANGGRPGVAVRVGSPHRTSRVSKVTRALCRPCAKRRNNNAQGLPGDMVHPARHANIGWNTSRCESHIPHILASAIAQPHSLGPRRCKHAMDGTE